MAGSITPDVSHQSMGLIINLIGSALLTARGMPAHKNEMDDDTIILQNTLA
jgi:hypothetical protein